MESRSFSDLIVGEPNEVMGESGEGDQGSASSHSFTDMRVGEPLATKSSGRVEEDVIEGGEFDQLVEDDYVYVGQTTLLVSLQPKYTGPQVTKDSILLVTPQMRGPKTDSLVVKVVPCLIRFLDGTLSVHLSEEEKSEASSPSAPQLFTPLINKYQWWLRNGPFNFGEYFVRYMTSLSRPAQTDVPVCPVQVFFALLRKIPLLGSLDPQITLRCLEIELKQLQNRQKVASRMLAEAMSHMDEKETKTWQRRTEEVNFHQMMCTKLVDIMKSACKINKTNVHKKVYVYSVTPGKDHKVGELKDFVSVWLAPLLHSRRCILKVSPSSESHDALSTDVFLKKTLPLSESEKFELSNLRSVMFSQSHSSSDPILQLLQGQPIYGSLATHHRLSDSFALLNPDYTPHRLTQPSAPSVPIIHTPPHDPQSIPHNPQSTPHHPQSTPHHPQSTPHHPQSTPRHHPNRSTEEIYEFQPTFNHPNAQTPPHDPRWSSGRHPIDTPLQEPNHHPIQPSTPNPSSHEFFSATGNPMQGHFRTTPGSEFHSTSNPSIRPTLTPSTSLLGPRRSNSSTPSSGELTFHPSRMRTILQNQSFSKSDKEEEQTSAKFGKKELNISGLEGATKKCRDDIPVSPHLKVKLKSFQKDALAWMMEREKGENGSEENDCEKDSWEKQKDTAGRVYYVNSVTQERARDKSQSASTCYGGILADEMGMGKTIQMLALIVTNTKFLWEENQEEKTTPSVSADSPSEELIIDEENCTTAPVRSTLIVCPLSVLLQWKQEVQRHASPKISVYVFHGSNRRRDPKFLASVDIVLTTYATLAADLFPGDSSSSSSSGEGDGNPKKKRKLSSSGSSSMLEGSKGISETQSKHLLQTNKLLRTLTSRKAELERQLTTQFSTDLESEIKEIKGQIGHLTDQQQQLQSFPSGEPPCLARVNWYRVVLDEAHVIKERTTKTAKAVFQLNAQRRWCMTGTPIQNKVEDLYSLVRFLQVPQFKDPHYWSNNIVKPLKHNDCRARDRLQGLLSQILMRRTKDQKEEEGHKALVPLPVKIIKLRTDSFQSEEQDFYNALENESRVEFDSYVSKGTVLQNYASILQLILRLRQACGHPQLVVDGRQRTAMRLAQNGEGKDLGAIPKLCCLCGTCANSYFKRQKCLHIFCQQCMGESLRKGPCPICDDGVSTEWQLTLLNSQVEHVALPKHWKPSTKICALLQELEQLRKKGEKAIVFSQWTSMLDHVQKALEMQNLRYVRLDGSMSSMARDKAQSTFRTCPQTNVFLISLKAGGQGLNLVCATHVFLLDPWWNPATEAQAIDRVHRMGQVHPVFVTRFVIQGTIEERILKLQEKKSEIAASTIDGAAVRSKKRDAALRFQELQLLLHS